MSIKGYIYMAISIVVAILIGICSVQYRSIRNLNDRLLVSKNNEKAYMSINDSLNASNIAFKLTVDEVNFSNDSLIRKVNDLRKSLKIKDRDLESLQYYKEHYYKPADTIYVKDTFIIKDYSLDTLIGDRYYSVALNIKYPNKIAISPSFTNEKSIIAHDSLVTIDPPKKCWLLRLFQKKQRVVAIDVIDTNPYIDVSEKRFIQVVK